MNKTNSIDTAMNLKKAKEIVLDYLPNEIFAGHNAIAIFKAVSDHADQINKTRFKDSIGTVQLHALGALILSFCKLYERKSDKYPNYSIPTAIAYLKDNGDWRGCIQPNRVKLQRFIQCKIDESFVIKIKADLDREINLIVDYFEIHCPQTSKPRPKHELDTILDALKVLRDKQIAHYEDNDLQGLSGTDLDGTLRLLAFAQTFVNIIGYGFFGFSRHSISTPEEFIPNKSILWPQMQEILEILTGGIWGDRGEMGGKWGHMFMLTN